MSDRASLVQIYIAFYNRAPDPEGLSFWQGACDDGFSLPAIADLFVPQAESIDTYPFLGNPEEAGIRTFLQAVYENLFNRDLDDEGETFWTAQILKSLSGEPGGLSIGEVVLSIISGAQGDDITTLANKTEVALDFHDQAALVDGFVQSAAATTASRLALSVVDETDFSVVQGKVLNENFFEDDDSGEPPAGAPFTPGLFNPLIPAGETGLDEAPVNGILLGDQEDPHVAVLADGKVVIAYETEPGDDQTAFNIRNADGSLSIPDQLLLSQDDIDAGARTGEVPFVTALPDGGFLITTEVFFPNDPDGLYSFRFGATGQRDGDPVLIADRADFGFIDEFDVVYLPTGNVLYTFTGAETGVTGEDVFAKVLTLDGAVVSDTQLVSDDDGNAVFFEDEVAAATLPDGTTLVVYETGNFMQDGDGFGIMGRLLDADGTPQDDPFLINEFTEGNQIKPDVSALGEDRFVVVFQTRSGEFDFFGDGISGIILDRDGEVEVDEFPVNFITANRQEDAQVTELSNGNFAVVWTSLANDTFEIVMRVFDEDGEAVGPETLVSTDFNALNESRTDPQIAATADGFVVTWDNTQPTPDDPFDQNIRMAAFDNDGDRVALPDQPNLNVPALMAQEFQVNDQIGGSQIAPSVVGLTDGRSVLSYSDVDSGKTFFEVRGPQGELLGAEQVAFGGDIQMAPIPAGGFVMVGIGALQPGDDAGVLMQIFDSALTPGPVIPVSFPSPTPNFVFNPQVTTTADGTIYVGWGRSSDGIGDQTQGRIFDAAGNAISGQATVPGPLNGLDIEITDLAVAPNGTSLAVQEVENEANGTSGSDIFITLVTLDLVPTARLLSIDHALDQKAPSAVALANGNFLIVYEDETSPGHPTVSGITGIVIDTDGVTQGGEFRISQATAGDHLDPQTTVLSDGRVLVTWTGDTPGDGQDIYGRFLNADGTVDGNADAFILNSIAVSDQQQADVSAVGDGFVASWMTDSGAFGDVFDGGVDAAVFDANGQPVAVPLVAGNKGPTFLDTQDLLDLQDIPLDGANLEVISFGQETFEARLIAQNTSFGDAFFNPFLSANQYSDLDPGEETTGVFSYTVSDGNNTVELVGSLTVRGYEDVVI